MEKPATIRYHDTKEQIVDIINKSKLPAFILVSIVEKIYADLLELEKQELEEAEKIYKYKEAVKCNLQ